MAEKAQTRADGSTIRSRGGDFKPERWVCLKCRAEVDAVAPSGVTICCDSKYVNERDLPNYDVGSKLNLCLDLRHNYPDDDDRSQVYVEQASAGEDCCNVLIVHNLAQMTLTLLDAEGLDELSAFFADAAQKLRYCSK